MEEGRATDDHGSELEARRLFGHLVPPRLDLGAEPDRIVRGLESAGEVSEGGVTACSKRDTHQSYPGERVPPARNFSHTSRRCELTNICLAAASANSSLSQS